MRETISALLLAWYDQNARTLPWRGIHDPYRTWVSETMLQQTRVETVRGYYERFLARFPDVAALAAADEADVLKLWEGLGYYSRARNLHQAARQVVCDFGGEMPREVAQLRQLKGIGAYTAGAIASIAFDQRVPAVDGNVIRVASRVMGIRENVGIPSVRRELEEKVDSLVPAARPGDFNQALMDLGAAVCVPGTPNCDVCPLRAHCDAYDAGDAEDLPVLFRRESPDAPAHGDDAARLVGVPDAAGAQRASGGTGCAAAPCGSQRPPGRGSEACIHAPNLADEAVPNGSRNCGCAEGVSVCYAGRDGRADDSHGNEGSGESGKGAAGNAE